MSIPPPGGGEPRADLFVVTHGDGACCLYDAGGALKRVLRPGDATRLDAEGVPAVTIREEAPQVEEVRRLSVIDEAEKHARVRA